MRIERTGPVEPLTPRVERFLIERLGGVSLDDIQSAEARRADFACLRGLLAVEVKSLEDSPMERMDNLFNELRERADWPMFVGDAPIESFIKNVDDPEAVRRDVIGRIGRGVINPLKKANRQLEAHAVNLPRSRVFRVLFLINEDQEIYDPHTVSYILWHAVRREENGKPLYEHVDAIMYFTERHATVRDDKVVVPLLAVEGAGVFDAPWMADVIQLVMDRWSAYTYGATSEFDDVREFTTIDHIPESAPRYERWRTDYLRGPYLRSLSRDDLRDRFDEVALLATLPMLVGTPLNLPQEGKQLAIQCFGDMTMELAERAIPITEFTHSAERAIMAAKRLNLEPHVIAWVEEFERKNEK
jgi:hypothetical protein